MVVGYIWERERVLLCVFFLEGKRVDRDEEKGYDNDLEEFGGIFRVQRDLRMTEKRNWRALPECFLCVLLDGYL